jgi:recombination protein RecA
MKQPLKAIDELLQSVEKQFGKGAMMRLGDRKVERVPCIPTGSPSLDEALGCGGYPKGRVVEVYGPESSGKTTLTLHAIAQCQAMGGVAAFIDAEHALDIYYAKNLGVQPKELLVSQPDSGEQALDIAEILARSAAVGLVVIDSVAALVPKAELEGDMGDSHMGLQARLMSQALRKLAGAAHRTGTTIVFINQLRMKIGVMFGSPETTTGGHALKYYASVRLDIRRIGALKQGDEVLGNRTRVKVVKNKLAPPFRKAEFDIRYGKGIDAIGDLLDRAIEAGAVEKSGAYYRFGGKNIAQGRENARTAIEKDDKLRQAIAADLRTPAREARKAA